MTTEPGIAPRATSRGSRSWRPWLKALLVIVALAVFAIYLVLSINMTSGGPSYPWDRAYAEVRWFAREVLAGFTGRSINVDLIP